MKNTFFEYNMDSLGYIDKVKKDSIIVLDANALLNLYRYNNNNREKFLEILDKVGDRLFLTNQSAEEFYKNRLNILRDKSKFCKSLKEHMKKEIKGIENTIVNGNFNGDNSSACKLIKYESELKENILSILRKASSDIEKLIDSSNKEINIDFFNEDSTLSKIQEIFNGKVNKKLPKDRLEEIYKKGKNRYKQQIPPGYEDAKTKPEPGCYGDLVIWNEMIEISKENKKNILFISDDRKLDWCDKVSGKDLGPRKELVREFFEETGGFLFYSFTCANFIEIISKEYSVEGTEELEEESEEIRQELQLSEVISAAIEDASDIDDNSLMNEEDNEENSITNYYSYVLSSFGKLSEISKTIERQRKAIDSIKTLEKYEKALKDLEKKF